MDSPPAPEQEPCRYGRRLFLATVAGGVSSLYWGKAAWDHVTGVISPVANAVAPILPTFRKAGEPGGWQRVEVPGEGLWTLRLEYEARDVAEGVAIATIAWASWLIGAISSAWRSGIGRRRTGPDQTGA